MLAQSEHRKERAGWKRRHRLEVVACILREALDWSTKTRLVYRANLNFRLLAKYLDFLMEKGLLEHVSERDEYVLTKKGARLLRACKELRKLFS